MTQRSDAYRGNEDGNSNAQGLRVADDGDDYADSAGHLDREASDDAKDNDVALDGEQRRISIDTGNGNTISPSVRSPRGGPNATAIRSTSSSVIASMRSAASDREIMAADFVREVPVEKPRWYIGDIDSYSIIDKVGSGTYG